MKKVIAFDLDGTLAPSKSSISKEMDAALSQLLDHYQVCVISGGRFSQFQVQFLESFSATANEYKKLHLMPTSGTHYLRYDAATGEWRTVYREIIPEAERTQIIDALREAVTHFGYDTLEIYGEQIEDRQSQVTLSVFGQDIVQHLGAEGVGIKERWDPDHSKRREMAVFVEGKLPDSVEAMVGGSSSIDIVMRGVDKAYGVQKLLAELHLEKSDLLFIGDALQEGGNDYSVKAFGIETIAVGGPEQTLEEIHKILEELDE